MSGSIVRMPDKGVFLKRNSAHEFSPNLQRLMPSPLHFFFLKKQRLQLLRIVVIPAVNKVPELIEDIGVGIDSYFKASERCICPHCSAKKEKMSKRVSSHRRKISYWVLQARYKSQNSSLLQILIDVNAPRVAPLDVVPIIEAHKM